MRFTSVGTTKTNSGLEVTDPVIVIDIRMRRSVITGRVRGFINTTEEVEGGAEIQFRKVGTYREIDSFTLDSENVDANFIGETIDHIIARRAKTFLQNKLGLVVTREELV